MTPPQSAHEGPLALDLPERFNLRDLGGLRAADGRAVAWRRLYRGASLHQLDAAEFERLQALGLRTVIDLRTRKEFESRAAPPLPGLAARSMPMFQQIPDLSKEPEDLSEMMADLYMTLLEEGAPAIVSTLELLAEPENYPVAFYCAAGKDRTGVMAAVVLSLVGVPREEVARDYARSDGPMESLLGWIAEHDPEMFDLAPASAYRALEKTMWKFLARVDERYGTMPDYLREIGLPEAVDAAVIANLLTAALPPSR